MKQTPMHIARCVGSRKLIFYIKRNNLAPATQFKRVGNANPSTIVNECNQGTHSRTRGKA